MKTREANQLSIIRSIIHNYAFDEPLHFFLKKFFNRHRQMGSRDRKQAAALVFNYFRTEKMTGCSPDEKLAISNFLCVTKNSPLVDFCIQSFTPFNFDDLLLTQTEKINLVKKNYPGFSAGEIFPFNNEISEALDVNLFNRSFLVQPYAWIRIRSGMKTETLEEIKNNNLEFCAVHNDMHCIGFASGSKLTDLDSWKKGWFEIQDFSSQRVGSMFENVEANSKIWDCCSGSGGKSLLLKDLFPEVFLIASDHRKNILKNAEIRFRKAGIKNYQLYSLNLLNENDLSDSAWLKPDLFDCILLDAPCSGSGTWQRTPEMLTCFNENSIQHFSATQKKLIAAVRPFLKAGGRLIYVTCSVFRKENEEVISHSEENGFRLESSEWFKGYESRADTLFAARLIKT